MKSKKMLVLSIVLFAVMLVFIPKSYAGGGMSWDVGIGGNNYDDTIDAYDGMIRNETYVFGGENGKVYFESDDFDEYIAELNKYLPKGVSLRTNANKTYDIYMNNVNFDKYLSFYGGWSGKLYLSGKNNLDCLQLVADDEDEVNIIGYGINELNIHDMSFEGKMTFKNCNINISPNKPEDELSFWAKQVLLEGRVKIEIAPNTEISGSKRTLFEENAFKNFLGEQYNTEYEIRGSVESPYASYRSPEAIIIKNYEDITLLEQSVEKIKSGEALTFRFDKEIEKFEELYINSNLLTKNVDYTIESGSTIVKLSEEYTKKLAAGNYEVKAMFTDGEGTATFEVLANAEEKVVEETKEIEETKDNRTLDKTPKTGNENNNNNNFYILLSVFTTITLGIILKRKNK